MKISAVVLGMVLWLGGLPNVAAAVDDEATLRQVWDDYMLRGQGGYYLRGQHKPKEVNAPFETAQGSVSLAWLTSRGIGAADLRGTSFLGLVQAVGWEIYGGLLAEQRFDGGIIELFGRTVTRKRGGFLGFDTYHKDEDQAFEFIVVVVFANDAAVVVVIVGAAGPGAA